MCSVNKDDEPFEPAAVAVARERVSTVCSLCASVETLLAPQIKLTPWTCKVGVRRSGSSRRDPGFAVTAVPYHGGGGSGRFLFTLPYGSSAEHSCPDGVGRSPALAVSPHTLPW